MIYPGQTTGISAYRQYRIVTDAKGNLWMEFTGDVEIRDKDGHRIIHKPELKGKRKLLRRKPEQKDPTDTPAWNVKLGGY